MRRETVSVKIGDLFIGSKHDVKTQSMTTASTADTKPSIEEAIRIFNAGGQLVRSAGSTAQIVSKEQSFVQVKLVSGEIRHLNKNS